MVAGTWVLELLLLCTLSCTPHQACWAAGEDTMEDTIVFKVSDAIATIGFVACPALKPVAVQQHTTLVWLQLCRRRGRPCWLYTQTTHGKFLLGTMNGSYLESPCSAW